MPKIGENALSNAIKRGSEEIHAFVTGQQEVAQPAQEAPKPSYEQALAETARSSAQDRGQELER